MDLGEVRATTCSVSMRDSAFSSSLDNPPEKYARGDSLGAVGVHW
jgi:hypothetical protein